MNLPPLSLLEAATPAPAPDLEVDGRTLRRTAAEHGVTLELADAQAGPQAVRYLFSPGPGVLPAKVERLADAMSVAVGRPVRYAGQVGTHLAIEVPRTVRETLRLRPLIEAGHALTALGVVVGGDVGGNVITASLAKLPHLLVGGATGQGKSVFVNGVLTSLLMRCSPADLQLTLIDPKRVELTAYDGLPHLAQPIVTDVTDAADALTSVANLMDERYQRMQHAGVKDIGAWNDLGQTRWPRMVVVIDELADLMMQAKKQVEPAIVRIAQLGRAAGIHLIVATQYPKADVITPLIKQNIPSRLALTTADHVASNLILGSSGAERLAGAGDGLWSPIGALTPMRVQAPYVEDREVTRVVNWWRTEIRPPRRDVAAEVHARLRESKARADAREAEDRLRQQFAAPPAVEEEVVEVVEDLHALMVRQARAEADDYERRLAALEGLIMTQQATIRALCDAIGAMP